MFGSTYDIIRIIDVFIVFSWLFGLKIQKNWVKNGLYKKTRIKETTMLA